MESRLFALLASSSISAITTRRREVPSVIGTRRGVTGAKTISNLEAAMSQEIVARTSGAIRSKEPPNTVAEAIETLSPFPKSGSRNAATAASRLLSFYPSQTPNSPREYLAAVTALLADYPQEVVDKVCDPRTGIATRCKFLPTIAEISEELSGHMLVHNRNWREEYRRQQEAPRVEREKPTPEQIERVRKLAESVTGEDRTGLANGKRIQGASV